MTFDVALQVVGWAGSALVVWSLLQTRILRLRWLNLAGCFVLVGFNTALGVWAMVALNAVLVVINVHQLRRLLSSRHDEATYTVVEVAADDAVLAHVLGTHAADITSWAPAFEGPGESDVVALVLDVDRVVGVVLARDAGDQTAQVVLDWVSPRYRDLTPGEFVYRRSDLFARHGFIRVLAPVGTVDPHRYWERVGFRGQPPALELSGRG